MTKILMFLAALLASACNLGPSINSVGGNPRQIYAADACAPVTGEFDVKPVATPGVTQVRGMCGATAALTNPAPIPELAMTAMAPSVARGKASSACLVYTSTVPLTIYAGQANWLGPQHFESVQTKTLPAGQLRRVCMGFTVPADREEGLTMKIALKGAPAIPAGVVIERRLFVAGPAPAGFETL